MADYIQGIKIAAMGVGTTLAVTAGALIIGIVIGLVMALGKMSKHKALRWPANIYVEIIRGTPLFVQILILAYGVPYAVNQLSGGSMRFNWDPIIIVGVLACGFNSGAYLAEIIRSGIQAVDKGQTEAARSLGMSQSQTMLRIILPQAVRNILPALGNEFIMILKETSLASTFFIGDLMTAHKIVAGATYLQLESLFIVGTIYLRITFPLSKLVGWFEKKMATDKSYKKHSRKRKLNANTMEV